MEGGRFKVDPQPGGEVAGWRRIVECREEVARLAGNPDPDSEDWRRDARLAVGEAEEIMADARMCRDHGLTGTRLGEEIAGNAAAVNRELRIPDASEALLRDWEAHAADAARQGTHPFHAPGYGGWQAATDKDRPRRCPPWTPPRLTSSHRPLSRNTCLAQTPRRLLGCGLDVLLNSPIAPPHVSQHPVVFGHPCSTAGPAPAGLIHAAPATTSRATRGD